MKRIHGVFLLAFVALLAILPALLGVQIGTSARCTPGILCEVGDSRTTAIQLNTDGASLGVDVTANTATLTATTTSTAVFTGADAAGAANTTYDTTGAGAITVGSADVTSVSVTTDGGTVTLDGTVSGRVPTNSLASGALTVNAINLATAGAADYDIPDGACDAAADVGNWVTVVAEDDSVVVSITSNDASNVIYVPGLDLGAGDELDSVSTAAHEGWSITLTCLAAEGWYMTGGNLNLAGGAAIGWADGGAAD